MIIEKLLNKPKIIAIIGNANTGKSNLIYHIYEESKKKYSFKLYTYGLKYSIGQSIYSVEELEQIRDSVIIIDEFYNLFDLEDNRNKKLIERTLRLIYHNNNILILCGVPNNFKKFISNLVNETFYLKCTLGDFINGSNVKKNCLNYKGDELGSSLLNLNVDEAILFNGQHYYKNKIKYYEQYDSKKNNQPILQKNSLKSS